ncbi:MAG: cytochrome c3 family protein [Bryobacterales bacterium]|nr:cytochrome c3 family protein [Bryobacterales bacterium]
MEHRISQYPEFGRLSLTPGHSPQPADSFDTAFGIVQSEVNAARCFGCHSTTPAQPGVHCQRCHGEGVDHPKEPSIKRTKAVALCAECHRSPNREYASPEPEIEDPASIRFAPVGLTASKCYTASKGALSCVTCHDPHTDAKPSMSYDARCESCHAKETRKSCPRETNCARCHMPRSSPIPLLTFTDHRIR